MQTKAIILSILFALNLSAYSNDMSSNFNEANDLIISGEFEKGKMEGDKELNDLKEKKDE